jgi:glycosyltransferase involved in cell wall biosynthesis
VGPAPPDRGGIARETDLLVRYLSRHADVLYLTYSRRYPRFLDPRRFDLDESLPTAAARPVLDPFRPASWSETARLIADSGSEAVVVPWWTSFWAVPDRGVFGRLEKRNAEIPKIFLCHNLFDHEDRWWKRALARRALRSADAFVCHSAEDQDSVRDVVPGAPSVVLPHPIEERTLPSREEARRKLGLSRGPLVLFLGLVRCYKGVSTLLAAAPEIVSNSGAQIAIVGEIFPDARHLVDRASRSPVAASIRFVDRYVPEAELDEWLAACDVVVLPYRKVSGSGIAARAVGAGRPVVASDVGGFRDIVTPKLGERFAPGDAKALADAVGRVLARGAASYAAATTTARDLWSWTRYARRFCDFLEVVLGHPVRRASRESVSLVVG